MAVTIKDEDTLYEELKTDAQSEIPAITNYNTGGVWASILRIIARGLAALYSLLRTVIRLLFLDSSEGTWLDLKAAEYDNERHPAVKTEGDVTFGRTGTSGNITIEVNKIVATEVDSQGHEYRYLVTTETVLPDGESEVDVPTKAEQAGASYNVGPGTITRLITPITGIEYVTNGASWLTKEGSASEEDDALILRCQNKWSQLARGSNDEAYQSWAMEVTGVVSAFVNSNDPRGRGTVDVLITGAAGPPSPELVEDVQDYIDARRPLSADVLVKGPDEVPVNIDITVTAEPNDGDLDAIELDCENAINAMFTASEDYPAIAQQQPGWDFRKARIVSSIMPRDHVINVVVNTPALDVEIDPDELATKGTVNVTVNRGEQY